MKKMLLLMSIMGFLVMTVPGVALAKEQMKHTFTAGDTIYVCSCGKACECGTMSYKTGKCGCGKEMVKATVSKMEDGKVFYTVDSQELSAPAKGKYICGCGAACKCGTVSQKPGNCGCGKPMKKVE